MRSLFAVAMILPILVVSAAAYVLGVLAFAVLFVCSRVAHSGISQIESLTAWACGLRVEEVRHHV